MDKDGLTPSQEELFQTLEMLDHDGSLKSAIAHAKQDMREGDKLNRGLTRVRGFTPNR